MRKRTRFFFIQNKVLCLLRTIQGWSQGLCCWHHIWGEDWERAWKEKRRSSSLPLKPGVPEVMVGFTGIYTDLKFFIEVRNRKSNLRVIHIEKITEGFEWGCRERDNAQEMILGGDTHGGGRAERWRKKRRRNEEVVLEEKGTKYGGTMEKMNLWLNVAERLNTGPRTAGQLPYSQDLTETARCVDL